MRIHHLNCGTMCPFGGRLWDGFSHGWFAKLVCHCWLIETDASGLVMVDTGLSREQNRGTTSLFRTLNRPSTASNHCALDQVERLGFDARDVRHVILTHLDFDHAGGLADFPEARVHVMAPEFASARAPRGPLGKRRYGVAADLGRRDLHLYEADGEPWFGFAAARGLVGLPPEILFVPLVGHTAGHAGVAVKTEYGWMFHAGDAYFYRGEIEPARPHSTLGCRAYQRMMAVDNRARLQNQRRLRQLVREHSDEVRLCSSHDAIELAAYQASAEPLREAQRRATAFRPRPAH